jgi:hypothetical protein
MSSRSAPRRGGISSRKLTANMEFGCGSSWEWLSLLVNQRVAGNILLLVVEGKSPFCQLQILVGHRTEIFGSAWLQPMDI